MQQSDRRRRATLAVKVCHSLYVLAMPKRACPIYHSLTKAQRGQWGHDAGSMRRR
jgi:hypothetical protein